MIGLLRALIERISVTRRPVPLPLAPDAHTRRPDPSFIESRMVREQIRARAAAIEYDLMRAESDGDDDRD